MAKVQASVRFWEWFSKSKFKLEEFLLSDLTDFAAYQELNEEIKNYNPNLIAEITIDADNNHNLIISCQGKKEVIPAVLDLVKVAPKLVNWKIVAFRPAMGFMKIPFQGLELYEDDIRVKPQVVDPEKALYDIQIFMKGYRPTDDRFSTVIMQYLDHSIGEYNTMVRIRQITLARLTWLTPRKGLIGLRAFNQLLSQAPNTDS